jgi:hypothetical protein
MAAPEVSGWDPIRQGSARSAGAIPFTKGVGSSRLLYFASHNEFVAALVCALDPRLAQVGRGDMSDRAARLRGVTGPDGARFPIKYAFEGAVHEYLPDYVARGAKGELFVIEGGGVREKATDQELAKLGAAAELCRGTGGGVWVVDAALVPAIWTRNALFLHLRRFDYRGDEALLDRIRAILAQRAASVDELVRELSGDTWPPPLVQAAAGRVLGDLLAAGRLDAPLERVPFTLQTPARAIRPGAALRTPPGVIESLDALIAAAEERGGPLAFAEQEALPDPTLAQVDPDVVASGAERELVRQRQRAYDAVRERGLSGAQAAREFGLPARDFQRRLTRSRKIGELAFVRYGARVAGPPPDQPDQMVRLIRRLYMAPHRPSITAIVESREVHELAAQLGLSPTPSRYQVTKVVRALEQADHKVRQRRAGKALLPLTLYGRTHTTERRPAYVAEFDEATVDMFALALHGEEVTVRIHIGLLVCEATREPLAVVVSPKALDQWDVRRLILRAILPKDQLRARYGLQEPLSTAAIPAVIRTDRGRIETSELLFQAAADLPFVLEFAPVRDAHAKPIVEAAFGALERRFGHRVRITTRSNPVERGAHDPAAEARRLGIDVDELERELMRYVFDVSRFRWNRRLRERPAALYEEAVRRFGVRTWLGSTDELRQLLKRDEGTRLVGVKGISYKGRWYGAPGFLASRVGTRVRIKVDEDDIRSIDVYDARGVFLGVATHDELQAFGRPVSRWEVGLMAKIDARLERVVNAGTLPREHAIHAEIDQPRRVRAARRRMFQADRAEETATQRTRDALADVTRDPARVPVPAAPALPASLDEPVYLEVEYDLLPESDGWSQPADVR